MTAITSSVAGCPRARLLAVLGAACALLIAGSADAKPTYATFEVFDVRGINASDTVTGYYTAGDSFVRTEDGAITQFHFPGAPQTDANSINDGGVIAGYYCDTGGCDAGTIHGFVRAADGSFTAFDVRGAGNTVAHSINNKGTVAGSYTDESGIYPHGFVRAAGGRIRTFDAPNAIETYGAAINDRGAVAGYYSDGQYHGFIRAADGTITSIDVSEANGTAVTALNAIGIELLPVSWTPSLGATWNRRCAHGTAEVYARVQG